MELISIGKETLAEGTRKKRSEGVTRTDDEEGDTIDLSKCQLHSGYNHVALLTGSCPQTIRILPPPPNAHRIDSISLRLYDVGAGELFMWGDGSFGKLGHKSSRSLTIPMQVASLRRIKISRVACGWSHTAAISGACLVLYH